MRPDTKDSDEEDEVLELERVETPKQQAEWTMAIQVNGPLSVEQFQDIERIVSQWQMESCSCECDFDFPMVVFPVLAG